MGPAAVPIAIGVSALATAAGTGLSFFGQQQQASAAESMANYNYALEQQQARMNAQISAMQNNLALQSAQLKSQAAQSGYDATMAQATAYEQQANRVEMEAREQAKRMREENDRALSQQRAAYGKAGVTSEGTPLMVMAETAGALELAVQDEWYKANVERRQFMDQAAATRYEAGYSLMDKISADYETKAAEFNKVAIRAGYTMDMQTADLNKSAALNTANNYRMASYGTLLEGASSIATTIGSATYKPKTTTVNTAK